MNELIELLKVLNFEPNSAFTAATKADLANTVIVLKAQDQQISALTAKVAVIDRDMTRVTDAHNGAMRTNSLFSIVMGVVLTVVAIGFAVDRWRLEKRVKVLEAQLLEVKCSFFRSVRPIAPLRSPAGE
jgi:hypothetical protein